MDVMKKVPVREQDPKVRASTAHTAFCVDSLFPECLYSVFQVHNLDTRNLCSTDLLGGSCYSCNRSCFFLSSIL